MKKLAIFVLITLLAYGPAWAAFATVADTNDGATATAETSYTLTLPDTIVAGDVCVAVFTADGAGNDITWDNSTAGAWTAVYQNQGSGGFQASAFKKVMAGTEDSAALSIGTSSADQASWVVFCFAGAPGTLASIEANSTGSSAGNPDPPSLTVSWGADDTLWFAVTSNDGEPNGTVSAWPCADNQDQIVGGVGSHPVTAWCTEQDTSATNDIGAFTAAGSDDWYAAVFAIQPAASQPAFTSGPTVTPATNGFVIRSQNKWPKAGDWINYNPPAIIGWERVRLADRDETILAETLRDRFNEVTTGYRIRSFEYTGEYLLAEAVGDCMEDFLPSGTKALVAEAVQPVSGDIVFVQLSEQAQAQFNRYSKSGIAEPITNGGLSLKIYYEMDGREILMNARQATTLADNEILGVVRYVQIDGCEAYVSPSDPGPRPSTERQSCGDDGG